MALTCWSFARMVTDCVWVRWIRRPGTGICHLSPCIVPDLMDPGVAGRLEEPTWSSWHLHRRLGGKERGQSECGWVKSLTHAIYFYNSKNQGPKQWGHMQEKAVLGKKTATVLNSHLKCHLNQPTSWRSEKGQLLWLSLWTSSMLWNWDET